MIIEIVYASSTVDIAAVPDNNTNTHFTSNIILKFQCVTLKTQQTDFKVESF